MSERYNFALNYIHLPARKPVLDEGREDLSETFLVRLFTEVSLRLISQTGTRPFHTDTEVRIRIQFSHNKAQ